MQQVELSVTIPVTCNDGSRQPSDTIAKVEQYLLHWAGGATVSPEQEGRWLSPDGTLYRDIVQVWTMYVDQDKVSKFDAMARMLTLWLDQEAILYTTRPVSAHFVERVQFAEAEAVA